MSEPVTALNNARFSDGIATITEIGPLGMITLRGDLSLAKLQTLVTSTTGTAFPEMRTCEMQGETGAAWMSPDEILLMCSYADVPHTLARMTTALDGAHALAVNVSDARSVFRVKGPNAREVLAKLAPVDLDPQVFRPGMFRRTRLAQVPAAFWMCDDETFQIICFRSVGQYVFDLLKIAAQPGSEVGHF